MSNNPVWHNIFRYIVLKPDNITFEADNYKDTINIIRGPGVNWGGASSDLDTIGALNTDQFMINVDYDISVPLATTDITLEDVNGNTSTVTFTAGRGVEIVRNSAQELEWKSYSVTETDTLQTVTERNNITNNKIFVNDIEVGTISSSFTEDGFPSYDAGHNLIGDGTLDDPLRFSPLYQDSLIANNNDQFEFTALGPGVLAYSASYVFDTGATTGSVTLEREDPSNPGTWVTLDIITGVTLGYSYSIQGTYAELYSGNVNYRLTYSWTGNLGIITWHVYNTFEGGAYTPINNPQIKTDTTAKTVDINDLQFFQNNIRTTVSNTDIVFDPAGTGKVVVNSNIVSPLFEGDLTGNAGTVTNGVYTTGSYANPTWITSLDASKIVGSIQLSDITIDSDLRLFDNVIQTSLSNSNLELRANGTGVVYIPDGLTVLNQITFNTTTNNQSYTTTGAGIITISSGTAGSMNNMIIGNSTAAAGTFTSLTASTIITFNTTTNNQSYTTTGAGIITISSGTAGSMNNMIIGNSTAAAGTFTSLTATGAITANTTTNNQSYTTTGAGTITITSGTVGSINNITIGGTTPAAGTFTALTATSNNVSVNLSPTGTGTVTIGPATAGSIENMSIGVVTNAAGRFTTLTATGQTTLEEITEVLNTKTGATGTVVHDYSTGDIWYHSSISANFTVNLTNTPTTNDRTIVVTLILNQGGTGYIPNALQINTVGQTIRWANNITPTPSANKIDVATFTLIRTGSNWFVLGNYTAYN